MDKIEIALRLRPYSHRPGASCLIPGTSHILRAFPTRIEIGPHAFDLSVRGPVRSFTVLQDLEKGHVEVFGHAQEGYYRIKIWADPNGLHLLSDRGLRLIDEHLPYPALPQKPRERLSLGSHQSQNIEDKRELTQIAPLLFALGQWTPGSAHLSLAFEQIPACLLACFTSLLVPRLSDTEHQGLSFQATGSIADLPPSLYRILRALCFVQEETHLHLPLFPFPAGRLTGAVLEGIGECDIEWRNRLPRRLILRAHHTTSLTLHLPKPLTSFRFQGKQTSKILSLSVGQTYLIDRFEK